MSILARIFGTKEVAKKAAEGIYNGIDAAILTDEERIQYHLDYLKAYEPFKLAQRLLMLTVAVPYVGIWCLSAVLYTFGMIAGPSYANVEYAGINLSAMNNEALGLPFAIVMGFYFAGGAVEGVMAQRAKGKK